MDMIKISVLALFLAFSFGAGSGLAYAEEVTASSSAGIGETIAHIEQAIAEIAKSDFNTAQVHLKAARAAAEKISTNEDAVKKANAFVIQGQIKAKKGDIDSSTAELNKALELYKSM